MSTRTVVTVSNAKGIKQYLIPKYLKSLLFLVLLLILLSLAFVVYHIQELNLKIATMNQKNSLLEKEVAKNKFVQLMLDDKESLLESLTQEKDLLEETLQEKIQRLIVEKNKIQIEQQFTLEIKNAREDSLVRLTNMLSDIESELKKESQTNQRLQAKLSLKIKLEKERIARERERKEREEARKRRIAEKKARIAREKKEKINTMKRIAKSKLGRRYVWGAIGPRTFDCSGYTSYVYKQMGIKLPRVSRNQAKHGKLISRDQLQAGDLIFFDTGTPRKGVVNHVGIYLGNNRFIHASSAKKRVVISKLNKSFYDDRYKWARRVF
jgi:cell wall-associated NlpC family hydrolase